MSKKNSPGELDARLVDGSGPFAETGVDRAERPSAAAVATRLIAPASKARAGGLICLTTSERRADEIGMALHAFAPDFEVLVLPPWDCLPYDRASPSRECMGRRMAVFGRLMAKSDRPRLIIVSPDAVMQRVPPASACAETFPIRANQPLDRDGLAAFAHRAGYMEDERIDEPGEIAILGEVIDVFPPDRAQPVRVALTADDHVEALRLYDPLTQRSIETIGEIRLCPASELVLDEGVTRENGAEHAMTFFYPDMRNVFELAPRAVIVAEEEVVARCARFADQVREAYETRLTFGEQNSGPTPSPDALYLSVAELEATLASRSAQKLDLSAFEPLPIFAAARNPGRAFCNFVQMRVDAGWKVAVSGLPHELRVLSRALQRGLDTKPEPVPDLGSLLTAGPGVRSLQGDMEQGFADANLKLAVITASNVLGGRAAARRSSGSSILAEPELRVGDVVIHEDHGLGLLAALEQIVVEDAARDVIRLEYHGGANLLVEVAELHKVWRYSSEPSAVTLDRLHTDAWNRRRAQVSAYIDETAAQLIEIAKTRAAVQTAPLAPPKAEYARCAARFAFPETPDQSAAIEKVLDDLASGRAMNRLVCGDVGFGKTEVALRAAAAVVFAGKQVALMAPTTVLARQHLQTFRRRFDGLGVTVAHLSRLVSPGEAKAVKAGLASGEIRVVVGTHAVASEDLAYHDLGLVIIDEEQKFGAKLKESMHSRALHVLSMTATPIPRTLQGALVGIQDISVITTPPARRRPIRTFISPFDAAAVRTALLREQRRGGQSFLVVPRIEDIAPLATQLAELAPELHVVVAHGGLPADVVDTAMVAFADGDGDLLLATNIIESGLDVPRANTMLIWRPDRFGLGQLHQLRGRVGRGRAQGVTYLLTDPTDELSDAARARLATLEAFDRLGSGFAISARDLDLRGSGELVGEEQAGHIRYVGAGLYQRLLERAVRTARGECAEYERSPALQFGAPGSIPVEYAPDVTARINLYARLARMTEPDEIDAFHEELEDRFGPAPADVERLLAQARLRALAIRAGVTRLVSGPKAVALTFEPSAAHVARASPALTRHGVRWSNDRLICETEGQEDDARLSLVEGLLARIAA